MSHKGLLVVGVCVVTTPIPEALTCSAGTTPFTILPESYS